MEKLSTAVLLLAVLIASGCASQNPESPADNSTNGTEGETVDLYEHRISFKEGTVQNARNTLESRLQAFNISYTDLKAVRSNTSEYFTVNAPRNLTEELSEALEDKTVEAWFQVTVNSGTGLHITDNNTVSVGDGSLTVSDQEIPERGSAVVDGTRIEVLSLSGGNADVRVEAYSSGDVLSVHETTSRVAKSGGNFSYTLPVAISTEAGQRIHGIAQNYLPGSKTGQSGRYLYHRNGDVAYLHVYYGERKIEELKVSSAFRNDIITRISVQGEKRTEEEALQQVEDLAMHLKAGRLSQGLELLSVRKIQVVQ